MVSFLLSWARSPLDLPSPATGRLGAQPCPCQGKRFTGGGRGGQRRGEVAGTASPPPPNPAWWGLGRWGGGSRQEPLTPLPHPPWLGVGVLAPGGGPWGVSKLLLCCEERGAAGWALAPPASPPPVQAGGDEVSFGGAGAPLGLGAVRFPSLLYVALLGCGAGPPPPPPGAAGGGYACAWAPPAPLLQPGSGGGLCFGVGFNFVFGGKRNGAFPPWLRPTSESLDSFPPASWLVGFFFFNLKKKRKKKKRLKK